MMTVTPGRHGRGARRTRAGAMAARRSAAAIARYSGISRSRCRQLVPHMIVSPSGARWRARPIRPATDRCSTTESGPARGTRERERLIGEHRGPHIPLRRIRLQREADRAGRLHLPREHLPQPRQRDAIGRLLRAMRVQQIADAQRLRDHVDAGRAARRPRSSVSGMWPSGLVVREQRVELVGDGRQHVAQRAGPAAAP